MPAPKTGSLDHFSRVLYNNPALLELNPADQSYKLTTVGLRESKSVGGEMAEGEKETLTLLTPKQGLLLHLLGSFHFNDTFGQLTSHNCLLLILVFLNV